MRHLKISRILGGRLSINSKLRGLRHLSGGALVNPSSMQNLRIHGEDKEDKEVKEFKKMSKPLKFRL